MTHYSKPNKIPHDLLRAIKPGTTAHLTMASGAKTHLRKGVGPTWESEFGLIHENTLHQSLPGAHHLVVDD